MRQHLVGKTITRVLAPDDAVIFGKAGTSGPAFEAALAGRTVVGAGSQGKYFWLELDSPAGPHPVMHFGMTGWLHIRGERTAYTNYYKSQKPADADLWPPRFCKFQLAASSSAAATASVGKGKPKATSAKAKAKASSNGSASAAGGGGGGDDDEVEIAFTDARRFSRVRLVACPGAAIRLHSPLVENGPDPVQDYPERFNLAYLSSAFARRRVPVKALLLDQAFLSGVGNWVGDEVLFQARVHPERTCDSLGEAEVRRVYDAVRDVCVTAVDVLGDSDKFPKNWLFSYRWGKGGKVAGTKGPGGERLAFVTVGGRTSCYAPDLQKKGGDEAARNGSTKKTAASAAAEENGDEPKPAKTTATARKAAKAVLSEAAANKATAKKRKVKEEPEADEEEQDSSPPSPPPPSKKRGRAAAADSPAAINGVSKKARPNGIAKPAKELPKKPVLKTAASMPDLGRRRSGRLSSK